MCQARCGLPQEIKGGHGLGFTKGFMLHPRKARVCAISTAAAVRCQGVRQKRRKVQIAAAAQPAAQLSARLRGRWSQIRARGP